MEYTLSRDNFGKIKTYDKEMMVAIRLIELIVMEPGDNPLFPDMGVGLYSNYHYGNENCLEDLESHVSEQREKYLPEYTAAEISFEIENNQLVIGISINKSIFGYDVDKETLSKLN